MELNESIYKYLTSYAGLIALISTRVYTDQSRQDNPHVMPYLTYWKVSGTRVDTISEQSTMLFGATYQFDVFARTRHEARDVAKQLFKAFKGFKGVMGGTGGVTISAIELDGNEFSDTDRDAKTGELAFRESQEFQIWYYET